MRCSAVGSTHGVRAHHPGAGMNEGYEKLDELLAAGR